MRGTGRAAPSGTGARADIAAAAMRIADAQALEAVFERALGRVLDAFDPKR